jgi:fatty acid desaturase
MNERTEGSPDWGFEWPTWIVIFTLYGGWFALVHYFTQLPSWVSIPGLIVVTAWFMSLQHEVLHGHPTRWRSVNRLFVLFPICPWFPYDLYRDTHLAHHRDELLTTPGVDPEANYLNAEQYDALSPMRKALYQSLRSIAGRSLVGSVLAVFHTWKTCISEPLRGNFRYLGTWLTHFLLLALLLWWLQRETGISPLQWVLTITWPALMLAMLRSFYEHRPLTLPAHRIVINEAALPWRLLYLNNNFHSVHHDHPMLPWYKIPAAYRADRAGYLDRNAQFFVPGYGQLLRHHLFKPVDSPRHPGFKPQRSAV